MLLRYRPRHEFRRNHVGTTSKCLGVVALSLGAAIGAHAQSYTATAFTGYSTGYLLVKPTTANPVDLTVNTTSSEQADSGGNANFLVFNEKTVTLSSALATDVSPPKTAGTTPVAGTISSGSIVSSIYFHLDPPGTTTVGYGLQIVFDRPILGLETTSDKSSSNTVFGIPGVSGYNGNPVETSDANNFIISGNSLLLRGTAGGGADDVRVLLNSAPEPGAFALIAAALPLAGGIAVRRRRAA